MPEASNSRANARTTDLLDAAQHIEQRVQAYDWREIAATLDRDGCAVLPSLLSAQECGDFAALYPEDAPFRSHIHMQRHGFGQGEYKYFAYPLPDLLQALRRSLYARLAPVANSWVSRMGLETDFPPDLDAYLARCHAEGQKRPTPLLLQYGAGDFNCLHQDVYGDLFFPLQTACLLSQPGRDFSGGEFVLTEQRPRMQSRPQVVALGQGDAVVFAVNARPVRGARGDYRVTMRHGVSRVASGARHTLGVIFHDAK